MSRRIIAIAFAISLSACALFQGPAGKQIEQDLAAAACVIAAYESGLTDPQALAQACQTTADIVINALAEHKKAQEKFHAPAKSAAPPCTTTEYKALAHERTEDDNTPDKKTLTQGVYRTCQGGAAQ